MATPRLIALLAATATFAVGCAADVVVTSERADELATATTAPPFEAAPDDRPDAGSTPGSGLPTTTEPDLGVADPDVDPDDPDDTDDRIIEPTEPTVDEPLAIDPNAINFGADKPDRDYDEFLAATITDLEAWWAGEFPSIYGQPFQPLSGGVYAAYPERRDDLPGCGEPRTTYDDVQQFVAFYCGQNDFIVYDDGDRGLLAGLAENFGAGTIGIVLAHEYGHAIQNRVGVLNRNLPTIATEQQADCFAGAWAGRSARSDGLISFTDADVRAGLIAMLEVRDPQGIDQFTPGGHGAGFDRVGAFQVGFQEGAARCSELIDDPLPLVPNQFNDFEDQVNEGNAEFGYGEQQLLGFLVDDLNLYWVDEIGTPGLTPVTLVPVQGPSDIACGDLRPGFADGAAYCPSTNTVFLNEPVALELYSQRVFGDFSIGYLIGAAWAEAVQLAEGSPLTGEARALATDCLTGVWVQTVIPVDGQLPFPRAEGRTALVSPGDLDEAVRTAIVIGDVSATDDVLGSPFEKIDAFRRGVLDGRDACPV